jgi:hypothetical protein
VILVLAEVLCHDPSRVPCRQCSVRTGTQMHLLLARGDNGGALAVLDGTTLRASGLKSSDDVQGGLVSNLAKDDVAAVEPRGDDGGDEELGTVALK